jgi:phosphoribosylamine--glycine ligase
MEEAELPFRGFLYTGLALTSEGPKVLEFNVRLGDPETQAVLPRMTSDLLDVLEGAEPEWSETHTVTVVLAADGYPEVPVKGALISGLGRDLPEGVMVFHAGTRSESGRLVVDGGRVLNVVGSGPDITTARNRAYDAVGRISWPGMQFRSDIATGAKAPTLHGRARHGRDRRG